MEVRNKLWEEFKHTKANVVCIRRFLLSYEEYWRYGYHIS